MNAHDFLKHGKQHALAALGVLLGLVLVLALRWWFSPVPGIDGDPSRAPIPEVSEVVDRHLAWARQQSADGLSARLSPIHEFFEEARQGTRGFAEEVLGFSSKWKLASDYVTGKQEHADYLKERFAAWIFPPEQLEEAVAAAITAQLRHETDVESRLLVKLGADLGNLSPESFPQAIDRVALSDLLRSALEEASQWVQADFRGMIGRELVSAVTGEVLAAAGLQLATSAGVLGTGAASGTVTLGTGIVLGLVADYFVTQAYDQLYDPVGTLSGDLERKLNHMERLILEGTNESPGLEQRMEQYAQRRHLARRETLQSALIADVSGGSVVE